MNAMVPNYNRRRYNDRDGPRAVVWSHWRRLVHRYQVMHYLLRHAIVAVIFAGLGSALAWYWIVKAGEWLEWGPSSVEVVHGLDGKDSLVVNANYLLLGDCNRLRVTAPLSLVRLDDGISLLLPVLASSEIASTAREGVARIVIDLDYPLVHGMRHALSFGMSCLRGANSGEIQRALIEVMVKEFTP